MKVTIDGHVIEGTPEELKGFFGMIGAKFPDNEAEQSAKPAEETPQFKEGDRVKTLADGEDGDIEAGEIGTVNYIAEEAREECDPFHIAVETDDNFDYFRPQDLEIVTEGEVKEYARKPGELKKGDIVRAKRTLGNQSEIYGEMIDGRPDVNGNNGIKSFVDGRYRSVREVELIAPVEARVDV